MHLLLPTLLIASLGLTSAWSLPAHGDTRKRAAYTLTNDPSGDNILALSISVSDGTLSNPVLTPTGGNGLLANTATGPSGPDSLFGSGSVVISHDYLFTVNPGSATVSMFRISSSDPLHPKLVGKPVSSLGEFPMSVAYSPVLKTACVLNGGAKGGVACFHADHSRGLTPLGPLRSFPVGLNQTTPPLGPPLTTSHIVFNPSSTALFVAIKGDATTTPPKSGYIYAWPVHDWKIATKPVIQKLDVFKFDFSIDFLGCDTRALITDASYGASIVDIAYPSLQITEAHHIVVPNQIAACWGAYAPRFDSAYIVDAGTPNITIVSPETGAIKGSIELDAVGIGGFDTSVDRTWMYVLRGDSSVSVVDLEGSNSGKAPKQVQKFDLAGLGMKGSWEGMAIYPS